MEIERAYVGGSVFFDAWVALMENHTRVMEVRDSDLRDAKILIISAPTDRGMATLAEANCQGESFFLCFSAEIEDIAQRYCRRRDIRNLVTVVAPFFSIPSDNEEFDAVYANCLFDLCDPREVDVVVDEMWRVLKQGGHLYSVHMGQPSRMAGRAWAWLLWRFPVVSRGFRPVNVVPSLLDQGFSLVQDQAPERFGFPLRYIQAKKPIVA
jgi:SAM-dependent methyltransferase